MVTSVVPGRTGVEAPLSPAAALNSGEYQMGVETDSLTDATPVTRMPSPAASAWLFTMLP